MRTYLLCSNPVHGHVAPMLEVARHLRDRGHRVTLLTGSRFADRVREAGVDFRALGGVADFDDRDPDAYLPDRERYRGLARAQYDIQRIFVRTIPDQYRAVAELIASERPDAVLVDGAFAGVAPLLYGSAPRPPILALGVNPLTQSSRDVAPAGTGMAPSSSPLGRARNLALNALAKHVLFRQTQRLGRSLLAETGVERFDDFIMDISRAFDRFLQLTVPEFEYPRSDLAPNTAFVGAITPRAAEAPLPEWWGDLDGSRPVVHVTQGTVDNHDFDRLVRPTVEGLADLEVIVVVSSGGLDVAELGALPKNARAASYLPYDRLLPLVDVYVSNGGYGGVQYALREGVPIVVAGDTEDKPEVAARIGWSGAGVNLRTGRPSAQRVREAVLRVLEDPSYRDAAGRIGRSMAAHDTLALIEAELEAASPTYDG